MAKKYKVRHDIDHDRLRELYESGLNQRELQNVFHICGEHLSATLDYIGVERHKSAPKSHGSVRKLTDYQVGFNRVKKNYTEGAKSRGHVFNLSDTELEHLFNGRCHYCGRKHVASRNIKERDNYKFNYNGIDRIDNTRGYTIDNVVSCCKDCNKMKGTHNIDEFLDIISLIYNEQFGGDD